MIEAVKATVGFISYRKEIGNPGVRLKVGLNGI